MLNSHINKLHVKYIDKVRFTLTDFDLLNERLQEYLDWYRLILLEYNLQVPEHKLPHC